MTDLQENLDNFIGKKNQSIKIYNFREMVKEIRRTSYLTHKIHKYPAKFIPQIPHYFIKKYSKEGDWIHDPFGGCGTTSLEAKLLNRNSSMTELSPLGCLICKVKTTPLNLNELTSTFSNLKKNLLNFQGKPKESEFNNIHYWFDDAVLRNLDIIKSELKKIENVDIQDFFKITLSSIIREVSKADPKIAAPLITKNMRKVLQDGRKIEVISKFIEISHQNISSMTQFVDWINKKKIDVKTIISNQDARDPIKDNIEANLVITSPPYINAHEYIRIQKIEMHLLDMIDEKQRIHLEKTLIGSERISSSEYNDLKRYGIKDLDETLEKLFLIDKKRAYIVYTFFKDIELVIRNVYDMLKPKGIFVLVIGNNSIRNIPIENHLYLKQIGLNNKFNFISLGYDEIKGRSLMTKRRVTEKFMDKEWVLIFQKN